MKYRILEYGKPLRVCLVDVGAPREEIDEPLGIEMIGGSLKKSFGSGVKVSMYSLKLNQSDDIPEEILEGSHLIGIGSKLNSYDKTTRAIQHSMRRKNHPIVVAGNMYSTFAYQQLLKSYPELICVRGEGENAVVGIASAVIENAGRFPHGIGQELQKRGVPNLVFIANGNVVETPRKVVDLSTIAKPERDFLSHVMEQKGVVLAEASRGCPWSRCKYCAITGKYGEMGWRGFPANWIIEELSSLSARGVKSPYFTDEDFFGPNPDRAGSIADMVIDAKKDGYINPEMNIYFNARVNTILGKGFGGTDVSVPLLRKLKEAGTREIFLGIESGSKQQIKRFGKSATAKYNMEALRLLERLGFQVDVGFIMFDPEMCLEDIEYNIDFLRKAGLANHDARMAKKMRVEPFTPFEHEMISAGIVSDVLDVDDLTYAYEMKDPVVDVVYRTYREWEIEAEQLAYRLQARCRGEVSNENERIETKKMLGRMRNLDLDYLETCVKIAKKSPETLLSNTEMKKLFEYRRRELIEEIQI